jgi:hypothetical protein
MHLEVKVAAPVQKNEITAVGDPRADYSTSHYPQKLALTSLKSGGLPVGIVCSRTQATEFVFFVCLVEILISFVRRFLKYCPAERKFDLTVICSAQC